MNATRLAIKTSARLRHLTASSVRKVAMLMMKSLKIANLTSAKICASRANWARMVKNMVAGQSSLQEPRETRKLACAPVKRAAFSSIRMEEMTNEF